MAVVRKVHEAASEAVAGGVEDVPVCLLDGDRQLLLGTPVLLAYLILLVIGEFGQALGLLQFAQREATAAPVLHVRLAGFLGRDEHEVIAQGSERGAFGALAREDAFGQVGRLLDRRPNRHGVVGQDDELGLSVAHFVRHVERSSGEGDRVEDRALEDPADAIVQFGAGLGAVDVLFLTPDDLAQVRFGQEAQRGGGAVVQVGGLGNELLACVLDEADVEGRPEHGVAEPVGCEPFERLVECQRVHEDGARRVLRVWRQAAVMSCVDFLGERLLAGRAGDVVGDGRGVVVLAQPGQDLLTDRLVARIDVVQVDRRRVAGPFGPELADRARQQPKHAAHALEGGECRRFAGQGLQDLGVQRVARA